MCKLVLSLSLMLLCSCSLTTIKDEVSVWGSSERVKGDAEMWPIFKKEYKLGVYDCSNKASELVDKLKERGIDSEIIVMTSNWDVNYLNKFGKPDHVIKSPVLHAMVRMISSGYILDPTTNAIHLPRTEWKWNPSTGSKYPYAYLFTGKYIDYDHSYKISYDQLQILKKADPKEWSY